MFAAMNALYVYGNFLNRSFIGVCLRDKFAEVCLDTARLCIRDFPLNQVNPAENANTRNGGLT